MELEQLKEEALKEYEAQKKALHTSFGKLVSKPGEWLYVASWIFMILAIAPPFLALVNLLNMRIVYLLPDGTKIISDVITTLMFNGQVLQQSVEYASRADILHALTQAGVASIVLFLIGLVSIMIDSIIVAKNRRKFVEQYMFEHNKKT